MAHEGTPGPWKIETTVPIRVLHKNHHVRAEDGTYVVQGVMGVLRAIRKTCNAEADK
jgi:hypothetical protein